MSEDTWVVDDSRFKETTRELEAKLKSKGIGSKESPNFDTVAAQWKTRRAAGEEVEVLNYRFVIILQPEDGQFHAFVPTLPGCEARGATPEEVRERLLQALYTRLTEILADGEMPPSDAGAEVVDVFLPIISDPAA